LAADTTALVETWFAFSTIDLKPASWRLHDFAPLR
jgi:hypothetical protein